MNNNSLSCHIKSTTPMKTLKRASRMINTKYKILHTTIQIENSHHHEDERFDCETHHTH
jgi:Co/Zn/Cd efflux system component